MDKVIEIYRSCCTILDINPFPRAFDQKKILKEMRIDQFFHTKHNTKVLKAYSEFFFLRL